MGNFRYGTLEYHFADIRNKLSNAFEVFKIKENHELQFCELPEAIKNEPNAKDIFIRSYIIAIVINYADYKDADILLAVFGFLQGYSDIAGLGNRRRKYCDNIGIYDENTKEYQTLTDHWQNDKNIKSSMYARENIAVRHLIEALNKQRNISNDVQKARELINSSDPVPNYLKGERCGYRKCEVDGKVFYIPLTEEERRAATNILPSINDEGESEPQDIINDLLPLEDETITQDGDPNIEINDPSEYISFFKRLRKTMIKITDFVRKYLMNILITAIAFIFIFFLIVATRCVWHVGSRFKIMNQMENQKDKTYEHIESSEIIDSPINGLDFTTD